MASSNWQPDQMSLDQAYSDLVKEYKDSGIPVAYESYLREYAKVIVFLQDSDAITTQLKKLNSFLLIEAQARALKYNEIKAEYGYLQHKKVLRYTLERELEKAGFQAAFGKATSLLTPAAFRSTIRAGLIIKDPGAPLAHGEFTHAIQWLLISWQQKDTSFLSKSVIELFKQLGDDRSVFNLSKDSQISLWDRIVDRMRESNACTSPEYLHQLIISSVNPDLSLLQTLCYERSEKRRAAQNSNILFPPKISTHMEYETSPESRALLLPKSIN